MVELFFGIQLEHLHKSELEPVLRNMETSKLNDRPYHRRSCIVRKLKD